jgi:hypothetical protein
MPQTPLAALLLLLLTAVLLWFALGTVRNIRRGNEVLRWLQGGLPRLGRRTTLQWLGSSAVRLRLASAASPLTEAELVIVLEPRDLAWLWAWSRRRGRRDFLIARGSVARAPRFELEAGNPSGWTGESRLARLDQTAWSQESWGAARVAYSRDADPAAIRSLWDRMSPSGGSLWRLSVRRERPHLEVHIPVIDVEAQDAGELITCFIELARTAVDASQGGPPAGGPPLDSGR